MFPVAMPGNSFRHGGSWLEPFFGPALIGILMQGSRDYRTGLAVDALRFGIAALIVIAVGGTIAPRPVLVAP